MITANQLRAARALLDISQGEIAQAIGISANTVSNIEKGTSRPAHDTLSRLQGFFETQGVEFTDNEGVRKKSGAVRSFRGHEGFVDFVRDVYATIKNGGNIYVSNVKEDDFLRWEGAEAAPHMERMATVQNLRMHILIEEGDTNYVASQYARYRWAKKENFSNIPLYIYGEKTAIINFSDKDVEVFLIEHAAITQYFRENIIKSWKEAEEIS